MPAGLLVTLPDGREAVLPMKAASADATGRAAVPYAAATVAGAPRVSGQS